MAPACGGGTGGSPGGSGGTSAGARAGAAVLRATPAALAEAPARAVRGVRQARGALGAPAVREVPLTRVEPPARAAREALATPVAREGRGVRAAPTRAAPEARRVASRAGLNIAWVNFANDVPNPDTATFTTIFQNTFNAGGRVVRWWFHTNGTVTPGYQSNGMAQNIPQSHIDGVKAILQAASTAGVAVNISLWSFDMLQGSEAEPGIPAAVTTNNIALLTQAANRQAYITSISSRSSRRSKAIQASTPTRFSTNPRE